VKKKAIPELQLLDDDQMRFIHEKSLQILSTVGLRVESPVGLRYFSNMPGKNVDGDRVYIPAEIVDWALKSVPSNISLYSRTGDRVFSIGKDHHEKTIFGIGVTNTHYQDSETGDVVPFRRDHTPVSTRLGQSLSEFDTISTIGIPAELSPGVVDLFNTLDLFANSTKPLVLLLLHDSSIAKVFRLIEYLHPDLKKYPSFITYVNPVTPLILNDGTVQKMVHSIESGCPVAYSNYSMYGATTPAPMVGTISLLNAELLAGLVLSQLIKEGASMILGSLPASFDMTTMASPFTSESFLLNIACAEMMHYYGIPHCGTSGSGAGLDADLPASDWLWINHLTSSLGKVGLAPFVGGNFESLAFSPSMVVYSNQIIKQVRQFAAGIDLDNITTSMEEIKDAGPGGDFMTSEQTLNRMGDVKTSENIWQSMTIEKWESLGKPLASDQLRDHVCDIMKNLQQQDDAEDITVQGEKFISRLVTEE
jgi:trimethylamine--corrinoid protein Co-methyltransferase